MQVRLSSMMVASTAALLLSSCVDSALVGDFAKKSQQVGISFHAMAADGLASCEEANRIWRKANPRDCAELFGPAVQAPMLRVNDALFAYIASLGGLAGETVPKFNFNEVNAALKAANASADVQSKAAAAGGLAEAVVKILTSHYRQAELTKIIVRQNRNVQDVASFLKDYAADTKYRLLFANEANSVRSFCSAQKSSHANEALAVILLERACTNDEVRIGTKLDAVEKFKLAILAVQTGHQKLADSRSTWTALELTKLIGPEIARLSDATQSLNKAF
jgi:hypothetical protein